MHRAAVVSHYQYGGQVYQRQLLLANNYQLIRISNVASDWLAAVLAANQRAYLKIVLVNLDF